MSFKIRPFKPDDTQEISWLFYDTVHDITSDAYTSIQINKWAPKVVDLNQWKQRLGQSNTLVAFTPEDNKIIGFSDINNQGHIDYLYVHYAHQYTGVGTALLEAIKQKAQELKLKTMYADVNILAKPLFTQGGFVIDEPGVRIINGIEFPITKMSMSLE